MSARPSNGGNEFITGDFLNADYPRTKAAGSFKEKAFIDPIKAIRIEYGLEEESFFTKAEESILAGPFSQVSSFFTNKKDKRWVNTEIVG